MKKRIFVEYEIYDIHQTDEYKTEIKNAYKYIAKAKEFGYKKYPDGLEDEWLNKIDSFIDGLDTPRNLGIIDPENFSDTYSHIQVPNTETTVFLLVEGNQIYLATSGWSRLPWNEILKDKEQEINKQIQLLKTKKNTAENNILEKNIKPNHNLTPNNNKETVETMEDEEHRRRQEEMEERLKWAKLIVENPDAFNAALKGISEAKHCAEMDAEIEKDFAPEPFTEEDIARLNDIENQFMQEIDTPSLEPSNDAEKTEEEHDPLWLDPFEKEDEKDIQEKSLEKEQEKRPEDYER